MLSVPRTAGGIAAVPVSVAGSVPRLPQAPRAGGEITVAATGLFGASSGMQ